MRQQAHTLDGLVIQLPEVDAEPQAAILLLDQDYCTCPWAMWLLGGTYVQHLLKMGLHIIIHVRGYAMVMLLEGRPVCYFDLVFN